MSPDFVILHLSDSHIGKPEHSPDSSTVLRPLLADLQQQVNSIGKPNLIVFSGDLAYGDIPQISLAQQYEQASNWIDQIYQSLGTSANETPFLLVPGNHDLNAGNVGREQVEWVKRLEGDQGLEDVYSTMQANEVEWRRIIERQQEWAIFIKGLSHPWRIDESLNMVTGILDHYGTKVGLVGFNSSWASTPRPKLDSADGRLWIGKYQYQRGLNEIEKADFKIAVAHHPTSWLNPGERRWMTEKIQAHFNVFLHGHEHTQWFDDSSKHLIVAAGACYQRSDKDNAYSWIVFNFERRVAQIWLRTYSDRAAGGWIPLHFPDLTDERGFAELEYPGKLKRTTAAKTESKLEDARTTQTKQLPTTVKKYIGVLQTDFGFRWETSSFRHSGSGPVVYWPVRLRPPTPIHAVQCFAAAGLQNRGCEIVLCIDDLGTKDYSTEEFRKAMGRWFVTAAGDENKLVTYECSKLLEEDPAVGIWTQVKQWLGTTTYPLEKVLRVSKLLPTDSKMSISIEELGRRRPRSLLTPAVVWTCLLYLHHRDESRQVITLSGNDELPLWQAWRECSSVPSIKVGHLYAPELNQRISEGVRPVHMSQTDLAWESKEDIKAALELELSKDDSDEWLDPNRLIPWSYRGCVRLPSWLCGSIKPFIVGDVTIKESTDLRDVERDKMVIALVEQLEEWLL